MKKYNITTLILMEIPIMSRIEYSGFIVMLISCTILILNIALISAFKSKYNSLPNMVLSVAKWSTDGSSGFHSTHKTQGIENNRITATDTKNVSKANFGK